MSKNDSDGKSKTTATADSVAKQASKAAPMNASGLTNTLPDAESGLVATEHLGGLDFEYASAYQQADSLGKTVTDVNSENNSEDNSASNTADQKTYIDVKEEAEKTGGERTKIGSVQNYSNRAGNTSDEKTENRSENSAGEVAGHATGHDKTTSNNKYTVEDKHTINGNSNDETITTGVIRLRYTGRDGLTPYEALRGADNYLRDLGPAIDSLINKLETCFIGVYDI